MIWRTTGVWALGITIAVTGMTSCASGAVRPDETVTWVGDADGDWANDADAWQRSSDGLIGNAQTIFGTPAGSNGAASGPTSGHNIIVGGGAAVEYFPATPDLSEIYGDFFLKQGTNLTIKEGAVVEQLPQPEWPGSPWTQLDMSNLILDGGTFRRSGHSDADGGGILLFGSWKADDNFAHLPAPADINILIQNGGSFENEGDTWFGSGDDTPEEGLRVSMVINNGSVKLTGGDTYFDDQYVPANGDLVFTYSRKTDGTPIGEDYEINFRGPGSVTVDHSGIIVAKKDEFGVWEGRTPGTDVATPVSYEELWEEGILKAKGMSGANGSGQAFANFFNVTGTPGADDYKVEWKAPTVVTWDGGTGNWLDGKWNGGQDAVTVFGVENGTPGGRAIVIDGSVEGGAHVTYDNTADFRGRSDEGVSSVTVKNGAVLDLHNNVAEDGYWTRWMSDLHVDGGTFKRTIGGTSLSSGAFILGGYGGKPGLEIDMSITNGGRIENYGQMWFGVTDSESPKDLEITMTINDGELDLQGGDAYPLLGVGFEPSLIFAYTYRDGDPVPDFANEQYAINFTGPGSITVDHAGIYTVNWDEFGVPTGEDRTYEELWDLGILQANGLSGTDGADFGEFFSVTGELGMDNYILTSLIGGSVDPITGDFNGNGSVENADLTLLLNNWGAAVPPVPAGWTGDQPTGDAIDNSELTALLNNWGNSAGGGASLGASAVPEPSTAALAMLLLAGAAGTARRRR